MSWIWVLVPLAVFGLPVLAKGFSEWLEFKRTQASLGASSIELEGRIGRSEEALEAAERRIEHLEAIVVSQVWDQPQVEAPPSRISLEEPVDVREATARIARRLME